MEAKRILRVLLISISIVGAFLCASSIAYDDTLGDAPGAHSKINQIAIDRFKEEGMPNDVSLKSASLDGEKCKGVAWDREDGAKSLPASKEQKREKSMVQWIIDGGWSADEPEWTMSLVHFYDPKNPGRAWLTDQQFAVNTLNKLSHTIDNPEISARDWAFDTFDSAKETMYVDKFVQDYSWADAKKYFKDALASKERNNENYGKAYRAVGETMHLMADMTVPAHVRNDGHATALGDVDPYESTTTSSHIESYSDPFLYQPAGLNYKEPPQSLMHNVADFTNSNFLSMDTVPPPTGHTSRVFHTYPTPSINGLTPDDKGYLHSTIGRRDVILAAPRSWLSKWTKTLPNPIYSVDNRVIVDQRSILIPTAIRANTALLDRFLPRFEVMMTKKETEPGSGRYEVHGEIVQAKDAWNKAEWPDKLIIRNGVNIVITDKDGKVEKLPITLIEPEEDLNEFTREVEAGPEDEIFLEYDLGGYVLKGGIIGLDFSGKWNTWVINPFSTDGSKLGPSIDYDLIQTKDSVALTSPGWRSKDIVGTINGNSFTGTFKNSDPLTKDWTADKRPYGKTFGTVEMTFSSDGNHFTGRIKDGDFESEWGGDRIPESQS